MKLVLEMIENDAKKRPKVSEIRKYVDKLDAKDFYIIKSNIIAQIVEKRQSAVAQNLRSRLGECGIRLLFIF